jgi:hypothetical protein
MGRSPPRVRFRLTRGSDDPWAGLRLARGLDTLLARGPASVESQAPPRASFRLARGVHRPATSILSPPAEAFNALTFAGAMSKANPGHYTPGNHAPALLCQLPWRSHPRHCATLCGVVSNRPAALYHPLPYGRRTAPSNPHADGPRTSDLYATRSRSWTRTGHAMTPRQKRDSPGQPSTPWHYTSYLHT